MVRGGATTHEVVLLPSARVLHVAANETVLEAALAAGLPFPHQCKAALCTACRCELVSGRLRGRRPMVPPLSEAQWEQGMVLACQSEPRSDLVLRIDSRGNRPISPV